MTEPEAKAPKLALELVHWIAVCRLFADPLAAVSSNPPPPRLLKMILPLEVTSRTLVPPCRVLLIEAIVTKEVPGGGVPLASPTTMLPGSNSTVPEDPFTALALATPS